MSTQTTEQQVKTIYTSLEGFNNIAAILEERAELITAWKADKIKLAKCSLNTKIQSEKYFKARIETCNQQLAKYQGATVEVA